MNTATVPHRPTHDWALLFLRVTGSLLLLSLIHI